MNEILLKYGFKVDSEGNSWYLKVIGDVNIYFEMDCDTPSNTIWYYSKLNRRNSVLYRGLISSKLFLIELLNNLDLDNLM